MVIVVSVSVHVLCVASQTWPGSKHGSPAPKQKLPLQVSVCEQDKPSSHGAVLFAYLQTFGPRAFVETGREPRGVAAGDVFGSAAGGGVIAR